MITPQDIQDLELNKSNEDDGKFTKEFIEEFTDNYVEDDKYVQPQTTTTIREEK